MIELYRKEKDVGLCSLHQGPKMQVKVKAGTGTCKLTAAAVSPSEGKRSRTFSIT